MGSAGQQQNAPPLTVEDYRTLPEAGPRYQLIEGDLCMAPAPNRYHQDISRNLEEIFLQHLKQERQGVLYHAPFDVYLDETNVFQPDIVFISNARRSILTAVGAEGAPDLVVEILSPGTARLDLYQKRRVFARCGVIELWIIQPDSRTIMRYRLQENPDKPLSIHIETEAIETDLLPGLKVDLLEVFREP